MKLTLKIFCLLIVASAMSLGANAQVLSITGDTNVEQGDNENYNIRVNFNPPCKGKVIMYHYVAKGESNPAEGTFLLNETTSSSINQTWRIDVDWIDNISSPTTGNVRARFIFSPSNNACSPYSITKTLNVNIDDD